MYVAGRAPGEFEAFSNDQHSSVHITKDYPQEKDFSDADNFPEGSLKPPHNPYIKTAFDSNFKTHAICESWNSGNQPDNLLWAEPADRLLRIIGNGVVKDGYNMFMTPSQAEGKTTIVSVAIYIESMSSFRTQTMDFEVDMYLALGWYDRRLAHNCTHPVLVTHKFIVDRLWQPDLYFVNSKFAYLQEVTTPNFMVIVYPDGLIFKSMRLDVTLSCMMDLQRFPMDKQECPLIIQSYAYVENLVNLTWHEDPPYFPFGSNSEIKTNDMVITNTRFEKCLTPYKMFRGSGNWSCIRGLIVMKRLMLFHVIQTYFPSAMLVSISWMSFWLDPRASPARITLTITTLLTLTTMSNGARQDLPQVSYIKALDIWLTFSQALIFLVLLEYSFVSYYLTKRDYNCMHRRIFGTTEIYPETEKKELDPRSPVMTSTRRYSTNNGHTNAVNTYSLTAGIARCLRNTATLVAKTQNEHEKILNFDISKPCQKCMASNEFVARQIDHYSRVVFPSVFLLFSTCYWLYYSWYTKED
ncbi:cation transporter family protein [Acanthocheilonema viteae]